MFKYLKTTLLKQCFKASRSLAEIVWSLKQVLSITILLELTAAQLSMGSTFTKKHSFCYAFITFIVLYTGTFSEQSQTLRNNENTKKIQ